MNCSVSWKKIVLGVAAALIMGAPAMAQHTFDGNILYGNYDGPCKEDASLPWDACDLLDVFIYNDTGIDPMLGDPYNIDDPDWVPAYSSIAVGANDHVVNIVWPFDSCYEDSSACQGCDFTFDPTCYRGAIPPAEMGSDWTQGWTYYLYDGTDPVTGDPRDDIDYGKPLVILEGLQAGDLTLTADSNYLLRGRVGMPEGTTLTIEPGVVCFGENNTAGYIVIERGATIDAIGTAAAPIILTSDQLPGEMSRGGWGGLVIHGRAIANCADCLGGESCESEGGAGDYCGNEDCDYSGTIKYLRVEYSGVEISLNNELNSLTMNALGCQTEIDYVQTHMGSDDGFEWFGGKVVAKHLVATGISDDSFDWQMGFRGGVQFGIAQQYFDEGDKAIEADNNEYDYDAPCRSNPTLANLTLVGPDDPNHPTGSRGIHLRRGTDAQVFNSIVMGWTKAGIRLEHPETVARGWGDDPGVYCGPEDFASGHTFDGNILYNNFDGPCKNDETLAWDACDLLAAFPHNDTDIDPLLADPYNIDVPNWVPDLSSIAIGTNDDVVNIRWATDPCYEDSSASQDCEFFMQPTCYRGALPPAEWDADWTQGWTYYLYDGTDPFTGDPRDDIDYGKPLVILEGLQAGDLTLTADSNYLLRGRVGMPEGTTLTIEPDVVCFGENNTAGYIVIERGATIEAVGTVDAPIILTSDQLPGEMSRGGWGGLVIHGSAIANCADCLGGESCESEGGAGDYCGNEDCDYSGTIKYLRVEYSGVEISLNNELNSLTMNALGCQTEIDYVQTHMGSDDGFEWFGGKVVAKHLVATGISDDSFDWQMGFRGGVQFGIAQQYFDEGDKAIEADNNEYNFDAPCRSNPTLANLTLIGPSDENHPTGSRGIHLRRGTDAQIFNSIIMGWTKAGIRLEHPETVARGWLSDPGVHCNPVSVDWEPEVTTNLMVNTFPNPVVESTRFAFEMPQAGSANIAVFDASGRKIDTVLNSNLSAGQHNVSWRVPAGVSNGAYFYRAECGSDVATGWIRVIK